MRDFGPVTLNLQRNECDKYNARIVPNSQLTGDLELEVEEAFHRIRSLNGQGAVKGLG